MPETTDRLDLPVPVDEDAADVPHDLVALANRLDAIAAIYDQGTLAARPAAGIRGRLYFETDTGQVSLDNGSAWVTLPTAADQRFVSIGDLKFSARKIEHEGWIIANGRALTVGQYPQLREQLLADGSPFSVSGSNPLIPDLRGRSPVGAGSGIPGLDGSYAHGQKLGEETVPLSIAQLPAHNHGGATAAGGAHAHSYSYTGGVGGYVNVEIGAVPHAYHTILAGTTGSAAAHAHGISSQGSGQEHENRPPLLVANWFVFAGPPA